MAKTSKASKAKPAKKSPQRKPISKAKAKTATASPAKRKSTSSSKGPQFGAAYTKEIKCYKTQGDYF